jgi:hypothetical protein
VTVTSAVPSWCQRGMAARCAYAFFEALCAGSPRPSPPARPARRSGRTTAGTRGPRRSTRRRRPARSARGPPRRPERGGGGLLRQRRAAGERAGPLVGPEEALVVRRPRCDAHAADASRAFRNSGRGPRRVAVSRGRTPPWPPSPGRRTACR